MNLKHSKWLAIAGVMLCAAVVSADQGRGRGGEQGRGRGQGPTYFHQHGYTKLDIPPGHYPPPGECRVWYPGRPPGQQPPPGRCDRLAIAVPRGAWLMRHPDRDRDHVHIVVYDDARPGTILVTGRFRIATGVFVDIVVNK